MVKKMKDGGKYPKSKLSAKAQAAYDAHKAAEAAVAKQARFDAKKKGITDPEELERIEMEAIRNAKKAKNGMRVYKDGGKEDLPTPEEIKDSRRKRPILRKRTEDQKKARRKAKKDAKSSARKGDPGTGSGLLKTATTMTTGPESLTTGQVKRRGRRLERSAEKAGMTKDQAYKTGGAEDALVAASDAGDEKKQKAANKAIKRRLRYQGQDKKRAVIPVGRKKLAQGADEAKEVKARGRGGRPGLLSGDLPELTSRTRKTKSGSKVRKVKGRPVNKAINRIANESAERRTKRRQKRATSKSGRR